MHTRRDFLSLSRLLATTTSDRREMIKPIREEQEKAKREKDSFAISLPVPGKIFFVVVLNAGKIRLGMLGGCATNNRSVYRGRPANILSSIAGGEMLCVTDGTGKLLYNIIRRIGKEL